MKGYTIYIVILIAFIGFTTHKTSAQFINNNANHTEIRYDFNDMGTRDSTFIFVFFSPKTGSLKAQSIDREDANFEWYKVIITEGNPVATLTPIKTELNVKTSEITNLQEGGYWVKVTQGELSDVFKAWIFLDEIKFNDIQSNNNCNFLTLTAQIDYRTNYEWYYFADINSVKFRNIPNDFTMKWSASTDIRAGITGNNSWQNVFRSTSTTIDDPAPLKDAVYTATMTNVFNNTTSKSSATIPNLAVYAKFEILRPNESGIFSTTTDLKGEALFRVKFNSKSINADEFTWSGYGNQLINFERNNVIWTSNAEHITEAVEYRPGEYPVVLSVKRNSSGCTSATLKSGTVLVVEPSNLNPKSIPNAFSPNGDGQNDYFTFVKGSEPVSLEYIDVKIFNRNGLLVYKYNGSPKSWTGWDGSFMGDRGNCDVGVYYYIISARGWDNIAYSGKQLTGAVHLFR